MVNDVLRAFIHLIKAIGANKYFAVAVGQLLINVPALAVFVGIPLFALIAIQGLGIKIFFTITSLIAGFVIGILWSSFWASRWALWAFGCAEESSWPALKMLAINKKLFWTSGDKFEHLGFISDAAHDTINEITERINEMEELEAVRIYLDTPDSITYEFDKTPLLLEFYMRGLVLLLSGVLIAYQEFAVGTSIGVLALFLGLPHRRVRHLLAQGSYISVSNWGIELDFPAHRLIKWDDLHSLRVDERQRRIVVHVYRKEKTAHETDKEKGHHETDKEKERHETDKEKKRRETDKEVYDLSYFKIQNYGLFKSQVQVFTERYQLKGL